MQSTFEAYTARLSSNNEPTQQMIMRNCCLLYGPLVDYNKGNYILNVWRTCYTRVVPRFQTQVNSDHTNVRIEAAELEVASVAGCSKMIKAVHTRRAIIHRLNRFQTCKSSVPTS